MKKNLQNDLIKKKKIHIFNKLKGSKEAEWFYLPTGLGSLPFLTNFKHGKERLSLAKSGFTTQFDSGQPKKKKLYYRLFFTPCFINLFSDTLKASGKKVLVPTRKAIIQRGSSGKRCWTTWECDSPAKLHFAWLLTRRSAPNRTKEENVNSEAGVSADSHE